MKTHKSSPLLIIQFCGTYFDFRPSGEIEETNHSLLRLRGKNIKSVITPWAAKATVEVITIKSITATIGNKPESITHSQYTFGLFYEFR
jgi:hypothetical protein